MNFCCGFVVPMPTLSLLASILRVSVSKLNPLTPPFNVKLVSLENVQSSELTETESAASLPIVKLASKKVLSVVLNVPLMSKVYDGLVVPTPTWPSVSNTN